MADVAARAGVSRALVSIVFRAPIDREGMTSLTGIVTTIGALGP
jgi:hypothetical protein